MEKISKIRLKLRKVIEKASHTYVSHTRKMAQAEMATATPKLSPLKIMNIKKRQSFPG